MFRREEHRAIGRLLDALDRDLFERSAALFAGGTRLVLELDEYRLSHDVDFLCSDASGYSELRQIARERGHRGFFTFNLPAEIDFPRETRFDQYGIRFVAVVGGLPIKLEIIREARIDLGASSRIDGVPVACAAWEDCFAEKLLANSDRWADSQVLARDLIDLAMMRQRIGPIPDAAWRRAAAAYGSGVRQDLAKALQSFHDNAQFQRRCFSGLQVEPTSEILEGVRKLLGDLSAG